MPYTDSISRDCKPRSGIALGGIGAGSLELRKDGIFTNWTIFNSAPLFGETPPAVPDDSRLFFVVRYQEEGKHPQMRLLQIDSGDHPAACQLQFYTFRWISGVARIEHEAFYPFSRLRFTDPGMPFVVELEAWHPFIPHDAKNSSLPGVYFDFKLRLKGSKKVKVLLVANLRHLAGYGCGEYAYGARLHREKGRLLAELYPEGGDAAHPTWGQLCLGSLAGDTSYHLGWSHRHTFHEPLLHAERLPDLDTVDGQNAADKATGKKRATHACTASLGRSLVLSPARKEVSHGFVLGWFFPNLYSDLTKKEKEQGRARGRRLEGHAYANWFADAADVARYLADRKADLSRRTHAFRARYLDSSLPGFVLDQVNSHLNTFSSSAWYTKAGDFGIQEGVTAEQSWGPLATIDVAMYGSAMTAALFPELDRSMLEVHRRLQLPDGDVQHGVARNFGAGDVHEGVKRRVDLAPQYVVQALRHGFLTGDRAFLRSFWPSVRKALDHTLDDRDTDGDGLPEMDGSNSSYDNFPMFGPASYVASQFLAALRYAEEAARLLGDAAAETRYRDALAKGRARFESKLWNGKYFVLYNDEGGKHGGKDEGCLSDQLIGQWALHWAGLGDLCDRKKMSAALDFVVRRNLVPGDGLFNCRWPEDKWLHPVAQSCWYDQANTFWTGVELGFAGFLAYEGRAREALALVRAVDERHRKAGRYFDHMEWGGHYYRAMSAWTILHGFLGYAARDGQLAFRPSLDGARVRLFFAHGGGTAHYERRRARGRETIRIENHDGELHAAALTLGTGLARVGGIAVKAGKRSVPAAFENRSRGEVAVRFARPVRLPPGGVLEIVLQAKPSRKP